jgi:hypothetical protein
MRGERKNEKGIIRSERRIEESNERKKDTGSGYIAWCFSFIGFQKYNSCFVFITICEKDLLLD